MPDRKKEADAMIKGIQMCCSPRLLFNYGEYLKKQKDFFSEDERETIRERYIAKMKELKGE